MLSIWVDSLGLGMYDNHLKLSGIRNGEGLASMSGHDLETKLGMKMRPPIEEALIRWFPASYQDATVAAAKKSREHGSKRGIILR